ncbi:mandelate racemase/muconate lactonizing enzyme family protein [Bosea caraganae]|uniref:Mandelate racemase/muconate lactonizing enzyme family protein n=1 Tax=Bosea caraganae TaxID=2763117 RepID=A0A370L241_9HYPH|nr:mandelate racemase/muconate lactonizing enzyme family protein [Bosea caraganae]RDJ22197.1 mandelate racemase/muconate lactonizing enzyme family protein [Bosea caraganae]RDJ22716.1 mandelate racemase/muconate lactonizing enzyme family protein [Bosea caraganae]
MTKIRAVRARSISIPLDKVTSLSSRRVSERHYGVVEVEGDDGHTGIGFCYVGSAGGGLFTEAVRALLAPVLIGEDPYRVEGLWSAMYQEALLQGRAGIVVRAISALDTAIWDRNARAAGLPLYKFLGAVKDSVPAYASGGYYVDGKTPEHLADEMGGYVDEGYSAVKMKVGRFGLAEEEERIAAVRERIGPDAILMLDANNAWSDLPTALRFARMYEQYDPYFLEEPFSPDDIDNHVRLAQQVSMPIATGEIEVGRWRFMELMSKGGAAILQTDACVCGGISEFRRIAATAASFGITLCPHWFHDLHAHLVASTPNARYVEFFADDQVLNFRRLVDTQLTVRKGMIDLPQRPGLGFDFDAKALDTYAMGPWAELRFAAGKAA